MILLAVAVGFLCLVPLLLQHLHAERHRQLLARQLRQSLSSLVHALRIGVGFQQALDYTAREGQEPLASEWRRVLQTVQLGKPLGEALEELANRVPLREMKWFVSAVQITQSAGGSLSDVLETLADTLQQQETLREKVRALTAQGKVSGILLTLLPFIVLAAMYVVAPAMATPMFITVKGQLMLTGVIASVSVGGLIIKKIVTIKVE
jgi:tight adherence protein B